jgi:Helix-turn-helix domain
MKKNKCTPKKETGTTRAPAKSSKTEFTRTDTESQLARLLHRLRIGPITTVRLVHDFDILHPPARVLQLRKRGFEIATVWVITETFPGVRHRVGEYVLQREPKAGTA